MSRIQEQLKNIVENLSKLKIKNSDKLLSDINSILWHFEELSNVETKWVKATISIVEKENKFRKDNVSKEIKTKDLLDCSKQKVVWNQIAISNIMN